MPIWKRAFCFITGKKAKCAALLLLLTILVSAVGAVLGVKYEIDRMQSRAVDKKYTDFTIVSSDGEGVLQSDAEKAAMIDGIETVNYRLDLIAQVPECETVSLDNSGIVLNEELENVYRQAVTLIGTTESSLLEEVESGAVYLKEGNENPTKRQVWIHEAFAEKNGLQIGSVFGIKSLQTEEILDAEVAGIFAGSSSQPAVFPQDRIENTMLLHLSFAQMLQGETERISLASYDIEDSMEVSAVLEDVRNCPLDWNRYSLEEDQEAYKALMHETEMMKQLIKILVVGIIVVCFGVLILVLFFWMRSRIHEIGILLSVGISKGEIILQIMLELALITAVSFVLAVYPSGMLAGPLEAQLEKQVQENGQTCLAHSLQQTDSSEEALYIACGLSGLVIFASAGVASLVIVRLNPREILSRMS